MATFKTTSEDYLRFQEDLLAQPHKKRSHVKKLILGLVYFVVLWFSIVYNQYLFAGVLVAVGLFGLWVWKFGLKKNWNHSYEKCRFLNEEIVAEFSDRVFKIKFGLNNLTLAVKDLHLVRKLDEVYFVSHYSGLQLFIPHVSLSADEESTLEAYRKRFDDGYRDET